MAQKAAGEVRVVAARPRLASCSRQKLSATSGLSPYLTLPYLTLPSEGANLTANGCSATPKLEKCHTASIAVAASAAIV